MSAPRTNVETQKRWHRAPLVGIVAVVLFALGLLFWLMADTAEEGTPVDSGAPQIDGRTGAEVPGSGDAAAPATPPSPAPAPAPATPPAPAP